MTSNLGADLIRRSTEVGFAANEGMPDYKSMEETIRRSVTKSFKPEFINRLDGVIIFKPLDQAHLFNVIELEVKKVLERLARKQISFMLDEKAKQFLVNKGFDPAMGARPLRRIIEQYLEDPLAEQLLLNPGKGGHWLISADEENLVLTPQEECITIADQRAPADGA
jgi:ATP-dependent Clp protease ATP-binding subunit ClpC